MFLVAEVIIYGFIQKSSGFIKLYIYIAQKFFANKHGYSMHKASFTFRSIKMEMIHWNPNTQGKLPVFLITPNF